MNKIEFKERLLKFGNSLIDQCFPTQDLGSKLLNNTCKYIYKNKLSELDHALDLFAKSDGEIDALDFISYMADNMIGDSLSINLKDYVKEDSMLANIIPDKTIVIHKEDLYEITKTAE